MVGAADMVQQREERATSAGTLLREAREERGWNLRQVADALKIRVEYLEALERNSLEGLPGSAYATGFLKSYANFLRLDTNDIVRRFKAEKSALGRRPELTLPMPMTERSIPGSGLFLIAVILIALGYGTWYYMSPGSHTTVPAVEPVPAQMLETPAPAETNQASNREGATTSAANPSAPIVPPSTNPAAPGSPSAGPANQLASTPAAAMPPAANAPLAPPATPGAASAGPATTQGSLAATEPLPATPSAGPGIVQSPSPRPITVPTAPMGKAGTETPASVQGVPVSGEAASATPRTYGQTTAGRIVVHANGASWIQVKENRRPIFTRVLAAGESYNVPDRPNMSLRTGNAGGIELSIGGKIQPALGAQGEVRNVVLDDLGGTASTADSNTRPATPAAVNKAAPASQPRNP